MRSGKPGLPTLLPEVSNGTCASRGLLAKYSLVAGAAQAARRAGAAGVAGHPPSLRLVTQRSGTCRLLSPASRGVRRAARSPSTS